MWAALIFIGYHRVHFIFGAAGGYTGEDALIRPYA